MDAQPHRPSAVRRHYDLRPCETGFLVMQLPNPDQEIDHCSGELRSSPRGARDELPDLAPPWEAGKEIVCGFHRSGAYVLSVRCGPVTFPALDLDISP